MGVENDRIAIFSFFSGAGFLDLGFEAAGFEIRYVSDVSSAFIDGHSYARNCMGLPHPRYGYYSEEQGDITQLIIEQNRSPLQQLIQDSYKSSNIVGFIGGSPCPDFSVGGKNRGRNGDHGKLSGSYVELICQQQPDFFVFENVKGLWRTRQHRLFYEELKFKLNRANYVLTERLINSIEYGVPQDRDRIILLGFKSDLLKNLYIEVGQSAEIPATFFPWKQYIKYSQDEIFSLPWPDTNIFQEDSHFDCPAKVIQDLTVEFWFNKNNVLNHPNATNCFRPKAGFKKFTSVKEGDDSKKSFKRLHRWRYSPTVCYGNNEVHLHPYKARRLSVAEALALQSLPREFCLPDTMTLTNMFKTVGNGVPYLAAKGVAETILYFLQTPQSYIGRSMANFHQFRIFHV
jgi:DNA (cytosine-5)-methyltransferase 1